MNLFYKSIEKLYLTLYSYGTIRDMSIAIVNASKDWFKKLDQLVDSYIFQYSNKEILNLDKTIDVDITVLNTCYLIGKHISTYIFYTFFFRKIISVDF